MFYVPFALKSLVQRHRQYSSLFAVCTAAVCIILGVIMITDGMLKALYSKAEQYYGGDIQFMGGSDYSLPNSDELIQKIRPLLPQGTEIYKRFDYDGQSSSFYYEGENARSRIIKGVDFTEEKTLFSRFTFTEGSATERTEHDGILLSKPIARKLGVHAGDSITIFMNTVYGYNNTMTVVVQGIFQDSSLFGMYTSYLDIEALRNISGYNDTYVNRICLYYPDKKPSAKDVAALQRSLEKQLNMFPLPADKQQFYDAMASDKWQKPLYALVTLEANKAEITMMTSALRTVVMLIIIPLIIIVAVGIGSSYRVIVIKRTVETGTFRALGLRPSGVIKLFSAESAFLLAAGFACGLILSLIASSIVSLFDFSFIPAFDLFLMGGHIRPYIDGLKTAAVLGIIAVTTLASVLFTLRSLVHVSPAGAFAATV